MLIKKLIFIIFLLLSTTPCLATVFIDTDWETGSPPGGWPCKNAPNSACSESDNFYGWTSPLGGYCNDGAAKDSWAVNGISTTFAHSGTKSFRMHRDTDLSDTCDILHTVSGSPASVYIRFYVLFPSSMSDYNTPTSDEPFTHFFFTNHALSGTGFRVNLLTRVPWTATPTCAPGYGGIGANTPYMWFNCEQDSTQCTVGAPAGCYNLLAHPNEWQYMEFKLDFANNRMSIWGGSDGALLVDNVSVDVGVQENYMTSLQFSAYESESPSGYTMEYYIDDIVVSDAKVGMSGEEEDTTAPAPASASIGTNGTTLTVTWTEASNSTSRGAGWNNNQMNVDCSTAGNDIAVTYVSGDASNTWTLTLASTVYSGDTCNLDFDGGSTSIVDPDANYAVDFTNQAVTNNSTQTAAVVRAGITGGRITGGKIQ